MATFWYALAADLLVVVHLGYVSFVVVGQAAILLGALRNWRWIRNAWFRLAHLAAISIVAFEALLRIACPLTVWERDLRTLAGQSTADESFVGRLVHQVMFYSLPEWVFTVVYVSFALIVLLCLLLVPVEWPWSKTKSARSD